MQLSILVKGARGAGKRTLVQSIADAVGFNVVMVSVSQARLIKGGVL